MQDILVHQHSAQPARRSAENVRMASQKRAEMLQGAKHTLSKHCSLKAPLKTHAAHLVIAHSLHVSQACTCQHTTAAS